MTLAAYAQLPVLADTPASFADRWWPAPEPDTVAPSPATGRQEAATQRDLPIASSKQASEMHHTSRGLASYYGQGSRTASGEMFNARELTAAHPSLPFGTRVRVTNLATGRSVTVRVNDRGPFLPGRVIDVSQAAAEQLGMVGRGVAKVKLDVMR